MASGYLPTPEVQAKLEQKTRRSLDRRAFKTLLARAGINKAELARQLKMTPNAICAWDFPPGYAEAYLNLLIAYNKVRP